MKGKRYTTKEKIRTLREEDSRKAIIYICREKNLSDVTFHRWKRQFGHMELQNTCVQTTGRSLLPRRYNAGWQATVSKQFTLIRAVHGRTVLRKAFTVVFGMNA